MYKDNKCIATRVKEVYSDTAALEDAINNYYKVLPQYDNVSREGNVVSYNTGMYNNILKNDEPFTRMSLEEI